MKNIIQISILELKRRKKSFNFKVMLSLSFAFLFFLLAFLFISTAGANEINKFYKINSSDENINVYIEDSNFVVDENSEVAVKEMFDSYYFFAGSSIIEQATQAAFYNMIRTRNDILISEHLLYLNINLIERNETSYDDINNYQYDFTPGQETEEFETSERVEINSGVTDNVIDLDDIDVDVNGKNSSELSQDFITPEEIETIGHIKNLTIIIMILFILNFLTAIVGVSFFKEKLNSRSSLLFITSIKRYEFIIGKLLPYFVLAMVMFIGLFAYKYPYVLKHPVLYLIFFVLITLYFAIGFFIGIISRSQKEYTFFSVFIVSTISLFLLVPAFIANYSTLGMSSLFSPILYFIQEQPVQSDVISFVIFIYLSFALVIFYAGSRLLNYEDLYNIQKPTQKLLTVLRKSVVKNWHYMIYGIMCVPVVWLVELLIVIVLLRFKIASEQMVFLFFLALVEELARNFAIYSKIKNFEKYSLKKIIKISLYTGFGFMVAEKLFLFITIAPFLQGYQYIILAGIFFPFLVHTLLTFTYAVFAEYKFARENYFIMMILNAAIHTLINFSIFYIFDIKVL